MGPSATPSSALTKSSDPPQVPPSDIVSSLPAPIVRLLVLLGRPIAWLRIAIEVLSWKAGRRVESWMVVGAWWGLCLGAGHAFKYLLPVALFLPLFPLDRLRLPQVSQNTKKPPPPESTPAQPSTQDTLLHTLSDLHTIYALLPPSPIKQIEGVYERFAGLGQARLIRGFVILWATWLALGWIAGYRALLALIGSVILLYPSPSFAQLLHLLSKSLVVRRSLALIFLLTFGSPPEQRINFDLPFSVSGWVKGKWAASRRPSLALAFKPKVDAPGETDGSAIVDDEAEQAGEPIYFKFEVHENQRWWMGLDWTSALLPQERPSWCNSHLLPASPPPSFPLPPSSSITLPAPTPSDPNATVKRTATWKWLDDDWSIVRAGPGQTSSPALPPSSAVPHHHPASTSEGYALAQSPTRSTSAQAAHHPPEDSSLSTAARAQSIAEQAFTKGLERFKARTTAAPAVAGSPRGSVEISRDRSASQASDEIQGVADGVPGGAAVSVIGGGETICERDDATDADGWVYGDNKWESTGPKGGLGRFTRRRRWQRRAVCSETIERIPSIASLLSSVAVTAPADKSPVLSIPPITPLKAKPTVSAEAEVATARRNSSLSPSRDRRLSSTSVDRSSTGEKDGTLIPGSPGGAGRDDVLRQRLKKAMGNVGG